MKGPTVGCRDESDEHDSVPGYPARSTRSGLRRNGGGGGGGAMLILDEATYPPIAFSAGLPGGIQLSQLPDPRNVREAMAAPDADQWKEAMDLEMENPKLPDVYELVPRTNGMRRMGTSPEVQKQPF